MTRFGISSWTAFERTIYADLLALALLFLICAALYVAGVVCE